MRIGVFCSGGDAPGMNACVRAVVRTATAVGHQVVGIRRGYQGLIEEDFYWDDPSARAMSLRSVSGILQRGGTILYSSRSEEFRTDAGQQQAADVLRRHGIDAVIPIGGDGTFRGARALARLWGGHIVACPGTIDNDLSGTDFTIGFHTAVKTAVDAVDKLRDTAESHERLFLVEVMGRASGYIALYTALAAGAEVACLPETPTDVPDILAQIQMLKNRGKKSILVIVAEGDDCGGAGPLKNRLEAAGCPFSMRVVTLGHVQRGGTPVPEDRLLATRLGELAARSVIAGETLVMAGEVHGSLTLTPLEEAGRHKPVPREYVELLETMAN